MISRTTWNCTVQYRAERDMPGGILSFQNQPPRHGTWKKSASGASGGKNAVVKLVSPLVVGFAVH
jgi:hypothetical protein